MTAPMRRPLIAGNWKMNGLDASLAELGGLSLLLAATPPAADIVVAPPATLIERAARAVAVTPIAIGGQDCHANMSGAHTGDISAEMLRDAGASHVILGHSERRADHGETDAIVLAKVAAARRAHLVPIVCVGETLAEREHGHTLSVLGGQIAESLPDDITPANVVIAYEPVWAIGTGLTPTLDQIAEVHAFIREKLVTRAGTQAAGIRILYGGSVKPSNARDILALADVDGALVGGASLKAADFMAIIGAVGA